MEGRVGKGRREEGRSQATKRRLLALAPLFPHLRGERRGGEKGTGDGWGEREDAADSGDAS